MTSSSLLPDLIAWSAQVACIAALGGLLPALLRLDAPGVRFAYFRALLVICLALPWLQGRQAEPADGSTATVTAFVTGIASSTASVTEAPRFSWVAVLGVCIAVGIAVRISWIAIGLVRLSRLRTAGYAAPHCTEDDELLRLIGTHAEIRYVEDLRQPVTFGVFRPLVLLPDSLRAHPAHVQRAVLGHELIHVQRHDWVWLVSEEVVRALLWFHPGVWWLISRVQLAREEVVDEVAMLATGSRRGYIEALAAFADETPLVPAAAFARQRHLFRRMQLISREVGMSSRRIAWSCAVMALVLAAGSSVRRQCIPAARGRGAGDTERDRAAREAGEAHHAGKSGTAPDLFRRSRESVRSRVGRGQRDGHSDDHARSVWPRRGNPPARSLADRKERSGKPDTTRPTDAGECIRCARQRGG